MEKADVALERMMGKMIDDNLGNRIEKFGNQLKNEFYYRVILRFLCDLGLVNQPVKFNTKCLLTFKIDSQRLFETKVNQVTGCSAK